MDVEGLKESLRILQDSLPQVPERVAALAAEELSLRQAAEEFLELVQRRQTEAADLLTRVEAVLAGLRRESAEQALHLAQTPDPGAPLAEPEMAFGERLGRLLPELLPHQEALVSSVAQQLHQRRDERRDVQAAALDSLRDRQLAGGDQVAGAADDSVEGGRSLQAMAEAVRSAINDEVERLGAEMDGLQRGVARDVDEMRRDAEAFEATFQARIGQLREAMWQDVEGRREDTQRRLEEIRRLVEEAVRGVGHGLGRLHERLREAEDQESGARTDLRPIFEDLEGRIEPIRHAIEAVREAANLVGIPF